MQFYKLVIFVALVCNVANAHALDLDAALQNMYKSCVDIDKEFAHMKTMVGWNTAVTGVGTGLGIGAAATGFAKNRVDRKIEQWEKELDALIQKQKEDMNGRPFQRINISENEIITLFQEYDGKSSEVLNDSISAATKQSKKRGNWRTGLLAGNAITNAASMVITSQNKVDADIKNKMNNCKDSLKTLKDAISQAKIDGEDVQEAKHIYDVCVEYEYLDLSPIEKNTRGVMISSAVGAAASGAGTITSALANSDRIRQDNQPTGKIKEQKLNAASNVLAVGGAVTSAGATVFNAAQIAALKKIITVSENCTKVLK